MRRRPAFKVKGHEEDSSLDSIKINASYPLIGEPLYEVKTAGRASSALRPGRARRVTDPSFSGWKTGFLFNLNHPIALIGNRGLITGADHRRPSMLKVFPPRGELGWSNFVAGNTSGSEVIWSAEISNLAVVRAGAIPTNSAPFLKSQALPESAKILPKISSA